MKQHLLMSVLSCAFFGVIFTASGSEVRSQPSDGSSSQIASEDTDLLALKYKKQNKLKVKNSPDVDLPNTRLASLFVDAPSVTPEVPSLPPLVQLTLPSLRPDRPHHDRGLKTVPLMSNRHMQNGRILNHVGSKANNPTILKRLLKTKPQVGDPLLTSLTKGLSGLPIERSITIVNKRVNNRFQYSDDIIVYNRKDHWARIEELEHLGGDCEDFALAKYWMLKQLGVESNKMRLVVGYDKIARSWHAILAVLVSGEWLILDNRYEKVQSSTFARQFKPVYSVNESGVWIHKRDLTAQAHN